MSQPTAPSTGIPEKSACERAAEARKEFEALQARMKEMEQAAAAEEAAEVERKKAEEAEAAQKAEDARKAAESRKRAADDTPETTPQKKKRAKKNTGKEKEPEEPKPDIESRVPCDGCRRAGIACFFRDSPRVRTCNGCHAKKMACQVDGRPATGPMPEAGGSGLGRRVWSAGPAEPGELTGEELMQTLLVEVQGLRREATRTEEALREFRAEFREIKRLAAQTVVQRNHWADRFAEPCQWMAKVETPDPEGEYVPSSDEHSSSSEEGEAEEGEDEGEAPAEDAGDAGNSEGAGEEEVEVEGAMEEEAVE